LFQLIIKNNIMSEINEDLKSRVATCRSTLIEIGVKKGIDEFGRKYPEFLSDLNRLHNLWYSKISDKDFTIKIESFVEFKKNEF
jgi:hypothetical protein